MSNDHCIHVFGRTYVLGDEGCLKPITDLEDSNGSPDDQVMFVNEMLKMIKPGFIDKINWRYISERLLVENTRLNNIHIEMMRRHKVSNNDTKLAYVASRYTADTEEERYANRQRAVRVGRALLGQGLVPILPLELGAAICGEDDTSKQVRKNNIHYAKALATECARAGAQLHVIANKDGSISEGVRMEIEIFRNYFINPVWWRHDV